MNKKMRIANSFNFYQDNDPKHKARVVQEWLLYNCPKVIKTPAQSPNLNSIENLWEELDRRIRLHKITSKNDLKEKMKEEWEKISSEHTSKIILNMENRLKLVIENNGNITKYQF